MAYNYEYPYIDPSRYNDDWLINTVKKLKEEWENVKAEWVTFKAYVENYLNNLNVPQLIKNEIINMINNGEMETLLQNAALRKYYKNILEYQPRSDASYIYPAQAIKAALADPQCHAIYFPAGNYIIDEDVVFTKSFFGDGFTSNFDLRNVQIVMTKTLGYVRSMTFTGGISNVSSSQPILTINAPFVTVESCYFLNTTSAGISIPKFSYCQIRNNVMTNIGTINKYDAIWINGDNINRGGHIIEGNLISGAGRSGIYLDYAFECRIVNNKIDNCGNKPPYAGDPSAGIVLNNLSSSNFIYGNYVISNGGVGILSGSITFDGAKYPEHNMIIDNMVLENGMAGIVVVSNNNIVKGNIVNGNARNYQNTLIPYSAGIIFVAGGGNIISGNRCYKSAREGETALYQDHGIVCCLNGYDILTDYLILDNNMVTDIVFEGAEPTHMINNNLVGI